MTWNRRFLTVAVVPRRGGDGRAELANSRPRDAASALAGLRDVTLVIAIYLYFCGALYLDDLSRAFGVRLTEADLPLYQYFIYSYLVMRENAWWFALIAVIIAIGVYISGQPRRTRLILIASGVLVFPLLDTLAAKSAADDARDWRYGWDRKTVILHIKPDALAALPEGLKRANETYGLQLLVRTTHAAYVFDQPPESEGQLPYAALFEVPSEIIIGMTIRLPSQEAHRATAHIPTTP
jgi:hypothetical protein